MISGKVTQYKLLWIGNRIGLIGVNIILTEKWVDKVIDISSGSDRMIVIKLLVRGISFHSSLFMPLSMDQRMHLAW